MVAMRAELDTLRAERETERTKRETERTERDAKGADPNPLRHIGDELAGTSREILGYCSRFVRKLFTGV